ncbi:hypothetical protein Salat_2103100 [Sesamum alatum]|uniref:Uncharacterized protein n=1 Tax=Sesamum alatum TaxID=300844 RepID=A0AAE1Y0L7_9LAMI|nr:hypothetical protein Salat_2103100 [Sesamum alatum]
MDVVIVDDGRMVMKRLWRHVGLPPPFYLKRVFQMVVKGLRVLQMVLRVISTNSKVYPDSVDKPEQSPNPKGRKICFCALGVPARLQSEKGKNDCLEEATENATVQVKVLKIVVSQASPPLSPQFAVGMSVGGGEDEAAVMVAASAQVKRVVL